WTRRRRVRSCGADSFRVRGQRVKRAPVGLRSRSCPWVDFCSAAFAGNVLGRQETGRAAEGLTVRTSAGVALQVVAREDLGDLGRPPRAHVREQRLHHRDSLLDRKSTRLNSSHVQISYAVFCLKKKRMSKR